MSRAVARRVLAFVGMDVVSSGRRRAPKDVEEAPRTRRLPLPELLRADVVSLRCLLTPETRHLSALGGEEPLTSVPGG